MSLSDSREAPGILELSETSCDGAGFHSCYKAMTVIITLLVVGILLMLVETLLPGLVAGLIGFCCMGAGVVIAYKDFGPTTGNIVLLAAVTALVIVTLLWIRFMPTSRLGRLFVTKDSIGNLGVEQPELVGKTGTALTALRPSGTAEIDGRRVDVVTEGGMIDGGNPVKVVAVEGLRVVVRAI